MGIIHAWSSGGGVQSTAIGVLIAQGILTEPDCAVISDTEREASEVWRYLDVHMNPFLVAHGKKEIERVLKSRYATVDLTAKSGKLLMPGYTTKNGFGKMPGYCSNEWKQRVVQRYLNERFGTKNQFVQWLGISTDEARRVQKEKPGKWQVRYPLIELGMSRVDCVQLVADAGLPPAPRSSCWHCPNRTNAEWKHLKRVDPKDFMSACALDMEARAIDPHYFTHPDLIPLHLVNFDDPDGLDENGKPCTSGQCFV